MKPADLIPKILVFITFITFSNVVRSQDFSAGINTETPNPNAVLHLVSPNGNQGFLIPTLTTAQRTGMTLGVADDGLLVFDTGLGLFFYYSSIANDWVALTTGSTELDGDAANELITSATISGNILTITEGGVDIDIDLSAFDSAPQDILTDGTAGNLSISGGSTLNINVDDADADPTNEIELPPTATIGEVLEWNGTAWVAAVDDGALPPGTVIGQVLEWDGANWNPGTDDVDDADADPANEIQDIATDASAGNISIAGGSTLTLNVDDADADPLNEIELPPTATIGEVLEWNGTAWVAAVDDGALPPGTVIGQVLEWDGANWNPGTDDVDDADADPTNEIQDITTDNSAGNVTISGGSTLTLNVDDADSDPTNEIELPPTATIGEVLEWNGTAWVAAVDDGLATVNTDITIAGDGTAGTPLTINRVNPNIIAAGGATNGQILEFDGTNWVPVNNTPTVNVDGTTITGDGDATALAVDQTALTIANTQVTGLGTASIEDAGTATGEVLLLPTAIADDILQYDGANWVTNSGFMDETVYDPNTIAGDAFAFDTHTTVSAPNAGDVLTFAGGTWDAAPPTGLTIPYTQSVADAGDLFTLINTGLGGGGSFEVNNVASNSNALNAITNGIGAGIVVTHSGTSGPGINIDINNASPALDIIHTGVGSGIALNTVGTGITFNTVGPVMNIAGGNLGDVLTSDALGNISLQPGGLTLPYSQTVTGAGVDLFDITNDGTGGAGNFQIANTGNVDAALSAATDGTGAAILATQTGTSGPGISIDVTGAGNTSPGLFVNHGGTGAGITINAISGPPLSIPGGAAGDVLTTDGLGNITLQPDGLSLPYFQTVTSGSDLLYLINDGTSGAGAFQILNPANTAAALSTDTNGGGNALLATHSGGSGDGVVIDMTGISNPDAGLSVNHLGIGPGISLNTVGPLMNVTGGVAGEVLTSDASGNITLQPGGLSLPYNQTATDAGELFYVTNDGAGGAGVFEVSNGINAGNALSAVTNGTGTGLRVLHTGAGVGTGVDINMNQASASGPAIRVNHAGLGIPGEFRLNNATNTSPAISVFNQGVGQSLLAQNSNGSNTLPVIEVINAGSGPDIRLPTGATAGYVLTSDALGNATWQTGGLTLPFTGSDANAGPLFSIENTGAGPAASFTNTGDGVALGVSGNIALSQGSNRTIRIVPSVVGNGDNLQILAGNAIVGGPADGGNLLLQSGSGTGATGNGGNIRLQPGDGGASGNPGRVLIEGVARIGNPRPGFGGAVLLEDDGGANAIAIRADPATTTYDMILPLANATGVLTNDGGGILTWAPSGLTFPSSTIQADPDTLFNLTNPGSGPAAGFAAAGTAATFTSLTNGTAVQIEGNMEFLDGANRDFGILPSLGGPGDLLNVYSGDAAGPGGNGGDLVLSSGLAAVTGDGGNILITPGAGAGGGFTGGVFIDAITSISNPNPGFGGILELVNDAETFAISIEAEPTMAADYTITLPGGQGSGALTNDGAGNLTWSPVGGFTAPLYDDAANVIFGTATPVNIFTAPEFQLGAVAPAAGGQASLSASSHGAQSQIPLLRANGSAGGGETALQSGDIIGEVAFVGWDGSDYFRQGMMRGVATGNWGPGGKGTFLSFFATPNGSNADREVLRVTGLGTQLNGVARINNPSPGLGGAIELENDGGANALRISADGASDNYEIIFPATQLAGALTNDGTGNLSWAPGGFTLPYSDSGNDGGPLFSLSNSGLGPAAFFENTTNGTAIFTSGDVEFAEGSIRREILIEQSTVGNGSDLEITAGFSDGLDGTIGGDIVLRAGGGGSPTGSGGNIFVLPGGSSTNGGVFVGGITRFENLETGVLGGGTIELTDDGGANALAIRAHETSNSYGIIFPQTQGTGALTNDGAGNLSWSPAGGGAFSADGSNNLLAISSATPVGSNNFIAGNSANALNNGGNNIVVGEGSAAVLTDGSANIIMGFNAAGANLTTANSNILIGSGGTIDNTNANIGIGQNVNVGSGDAIAIGAGASATGNFSIALGSGTSATQNNSAIIGNPANPLDVGIGTNLPSARLEVQTSSGESTDAMLLTHIADAGSALNIGVPATANFDPALLINQNADGEAINARIGNAASISPLLIAQHLGDAPVAFFDQANGGSATPVVSIVKAGAGPDIELSGTGPAFRSAGSTIGHVFTVTNAAGDIGLQAVPTGGFAVDPGDNIYSSNSGVAGPVGTNNFAAGGVGGALAAPGTSLGSGSDNILIGAGAGGALDAGSSNFLFGFDAGGAAMINGNGNILMGSNSTNGDDSDNNIGIGDGVNVAAGSAIAIGAGSSTTGNNSIALGSGASSTGTNTIALGAGVTAGQDDSGVIGDPGIPNYAIGIGTNTPSAKLDVQSTGTPLDVVSITNDGSGRGLAVDIVNNTNSSAAFEARNQGIGNAVFITNQNTTSGADAMFVQTLGQGAAAVFQISNNTSTAPALAVNTNGDDSNAITVNKAGINGNGLAIDMNGGGNAALLIANTNPGVPSIAADGDMDLSGNAIIGQDLDVGRRIFSASITVGLNVPNTNRLVRIGGGGGVTFDNGVADGQEIIVVCESGTPTIPNGGILRLDQSQGPFNMNPGSSIHLVWLTAPINQWVEISRSQ